MLEQLPPYPATEGIAVQFRFILRWAMRYVATRVVRPPSGWHGVQVPLRFENLINGWMIRQRDRILAVLARIEAGTQPAPRPYRARPCKAQEVRPDAEETPPPPASERKPPVRLPRLRGWVCVLAQEVGGLGALLEKLLDQAEMREKVLAHPQLARLLRPVMRALHTPTPDWMPKPAKRPKRLRPPVSTRWRLPRPPLSETGSAEDPIADDPWRRLDNFVELVRAKQFANFNAIPPVSARIVVTLDEAVAAGAWTRPEFSAASPPPPQPPPPPGHTWRNAAWRGTGWVPWQNGA